MTTVLPTDPAPLSAQQLGALASMAGRELAWGLPAVSRMTRQGIRAARAIPAGPIRVDAIHALTRKRGHTDGAALFAASPPRRDPELLQALVAYEMILDFLDNVSERHPTEANGRELHLALVEALQPAVPLSDYYRHHPWSDDGGYLRSLVERCRAACAGLPSYARVQPLLVEATWRAQVLALNHLREDGQRDGALEAWARMEFPDVGGLSWFELGGAASASLVVHAMLALAAAPRVRDGDVTATHDAYWPWPSLATAMLDSYVDQAEDARNVDHSYISHYPDSAAAADRLCEAIERALRGARALPGGHRHALLIASMVALYLSKDSALDAELRDTTRRLVAAGGSLTRLLVPVLRLWRLRYRQRSA
jgi:tetraprenyl-beta-curcumene synthase